MSDQPKPATGEWTADMVKIRCHGGDWQFCADSINAALDAAQMRQMDKDDAMWSAKLDVAERSAKAWEEDAHRYATNAENCAEVIQQLREQLAAERAEREKSDVFWQEYREREK